MPRKTWTEEQRVRQRASTKRWRESHREQDLERNRRYKEKLSPAKIQRYRLNHRVSRHGLTVAQYQAALEEQGGACDICHTPLDPGRGATSAHIDHDHLTGKVRGILCANCNRGVGMFQDSPWRCEAAAAYLRKWKR